MKTYLTAVAAVAFFLLGNNAHAVSEWRGGGYVTFQTQACVDEGFRPIEFRLVRYVPPNVGTNGPSTRLVFYLRWGAVSYRLPSGELGTTFQNVEGGRTFRGTQFFDNQAKMRVIVRRPIVVAENTPSVRLSGVILNFEDVLGCRAVFDVSLARDPG
jgi:hypothetical protein